MEDLNPLLNDADDYLDRVEIVGEEARPPTIGDSSDELSRLGPLLSLDAEDVYSKNEVLAKYLTLRLANEQYMKNGGCKYTGRKPAEFDGCATKGCVSPLRRFDNVMGHFATRTDNLKKSMTMCICLEPEILHSMIEMSQSLNRDLTASLNKGRLWSLARTNVCYSYDNEHWVYGPVVLPDIVRTALGLIATSFKPPLSFHSYHAYLESTEFKDVTKSYGVYCEPLETTAIPGMMGTAHNCQIVDLAQEAEGDTADISLREEYLEGYDGFLCAGHTAHSLEAGRVRRVCMGTYIRIFGSNIVDKLVRGLEIADKYNIGSRDYLLFCMGKMIMCNIRCIIALRNFFNSAAGSECQTPLITINTTTRTAMLSISSGELLRRDSLGTVISTTSVESSPWPDGRYVPNHPSVDDPTMLKYYFSVYFQLVPYIMHDRPPRTLIASVQHIQAVAVPYGVGTSSVQPIHVSKPTVSTELIEEVLNDTSSGIPDNMPGENLVVAFINHNDTNEDSIIFSKGSAARGLFNYMAYSSNVVNSTEDIPEVGEMAHIKSNRWWKVYDNKHLNENIHKQARLENKHGRLVHAEVDGRGRVVSKATTTSGQISVKMLRFCMPATGDKVATGHGQKGTIKLWNEEDMPYGIDENGEVIKFDMVISLPSIANRLTDGQYYEMVSGAKSTREGKRLVIAPADSPVEHMETVIYDGVTGQILVRTDEDNMKGMESWEGDIPVMASWGICRVWQMTQMTFDKQHYTHNTAGKYSVNTTTGRTAGGGIREGEMELHAGVSSGLLSCKEEIKSRVDLVRVCICTRCDRVYGQTCICGDQATPVEAAIPHALLVYDYSNVIVNGQVLNYKLQS